METTPKLETLFTARGLSKYCPVIFFVKFAELNILCVQVSTIPAAETKAMIQIGIQQQPLVKIIRLIFRCRTLYVSSMRPASLCLRSVILQDITFTFKIIDIYMDLDR